MLLSLHLRTHQIQHLRGGSQHRTTSVSRSNIGWILQPAQEELLPSGTVLQPLGKRG